MSLQELYCKIESQARVVGACIRSAEKEINERLQQQQQQQEAEGNDEQNLNSIESTSSSQQLKRSSLASVSSVKGLEKRYHLLYLKAFEIQCMLESLLSKKEDQVSDLYNYVKMMLRLCGPSRRRRLRRWWQLVASAFPSDPLDEV